MAESSIAGEKAPREEPAPSRVGPQAAAPARVLDWVFSLPFLLAFGAILVLFDPLQRLARLFGPRPHEIVVGWLNVALVAACHLCGTRLEVERAPGVRPNTPYLLIANHQSMFDIPIVGSLLLTNYPKYVSKRELARRIPSISYNLRRGGNALIDRADRAQAVDAIRALGERAQTRGVSVVIYPEGTRSRSGELKPFKPAGVITLLQAAPALEVVPVTIDGSWRLLCHNLLPVPYGTRIRVRFADPIPRSVENDPARILDRVHGEIEETLLRWRKS
ncbi:MAG: lysophospholipid acyltransferase family protein [Proteobacteria bacterium]|nr:lysophospholipid acyltransferase family protein [Pseudomonadota bacterium]